MNAYKHSSLLRWHQEQSEKRQLGHENEIDQAEIRQALRGVKNGWHGIVKDHSQMLEEYLMYLSPTIWAKIKVIYDLRQADSQKK